MSAGLIFMGMECGASRCVAVIEMLGLRVHERSGWWMRARLTPPAGVGCINDKNLWFGFRGWEGATARLLVNISQSGDRLAISRGGVDGSSVGYKVHTSQTGYLLCRCHARPWASYGLP